MQPSPTHPHSFVMPVVREILPPWHKKRTLTQRELVAASLIARPEAPGSKV
jgi:hypothetical protein